MPSEDDKGGREDLQKDIFIALLMHHIIMMIIIVMIKQQ